MCVCMCAHVCVRGVCMYILLDVSFLPGGVFSNNFPSLLYIHLLCDAQVFFHEWTDEEGERGEEARKWWWWWWCQKAQRGKSQYFTAAQLYILALSIYYFHTLLPSPLALYSLVRSGVAIETPCLIGYFSPPLHSLTSTPHVAAAEAAAFPPPTPWWIIHVKEAKRQMWECR